MNKKKIINDPVYGFVTIPYGIVFDLIEHPYFQRLRRIKQLGLTHYVYPGALHTRFHHALGAMHLMTQAVKVLRSKGVDITDEEAEAATIAILLHDIGHGPFSHALEHTIVDVHHEDLSLRFMEAFNIEFEGKLTLAIDIFSGKYHKNFLHQLVSSQLDMDRMDYLNRDSFFTGVHEGVIGYDRIIKMLSVKDGELVVEEKGIYSVEKFLVSRRLMYWQVYLHKTVVSAEQTLIRILKRMKELAQKGRELNISDSLRFFLYGNNAADLLENYARLDDIDIIMAIKESTKHNDFVLSFLSKGIINRRLLKIKLQNEPFNRDDINEMRHKTEKNYPIEKKDIKYLVFEGKEIISSYSHLEEIKILFKTGEVLPVSECSDHGIEPRTMMKHYLCYPFLNK